MSSSLLLVGLGVLQTVAFLLGGMAYEAEEDRVAVLMILAGIAFLSSYTYLLV